MSVKKIIQLWSEIRQGLLDTIGKFDGGDLDYVPHENGFSVRRIILHIAQEEFGEVQYGLTYKLNQFPPEYPEDEYKTLESIKLLLAKVHEETIEALEGFDDDRLHGNFEAQWGETKPLIDFIIHVMEHETHHRGELSLILGLLGREGLDA